MDGNLTEDGDNLEFEAVPSDPIESFVRHALDIDQNIGTPHGEVSKVIYAHIRQELRAQSFGREIEAVLAAVTTPGENVDPHGVLSVRSDQLGRLDSPGDLPIRDLAELQRRTRHAIGRIEDEIRIIDNQRRSLIDSAMLRLGFLLDPSTRDYRVLAFATHRSRTGAPVMTYDAKEAIEAIRSLDPGVLDDREGGTIPTAERELQSRLVAVAVFQQVAAILEMAQTTLRRLMRLDAEVRDLAEEARSADAKVSEVVRRRRAHHDEAIRAQQELERYARENNVAVVAVVLVAPGLVTSVYGSGVAASGTAQGMVALMVQVVVVGLIGVRALATTGDDQRHPAETTFLFLSTMLALTVLTVAWTVIPGLGAWERWAMVLLAVSTVIAVIIRLGQAHH